ncbi:MAG: glycine cleavage system protein GcvH [Methanomassiliicoccales archaeon]
MSSVPDDLEYTETHEWIRKESKGWRIGITDHAQSELTDVVYVEFAPKGKIKAGEVLATIESVKTVSEVYAPVDGEILEVNSSIADHPETINKDPYGGGWFALLKPAGEGNLLKPQEYRKLIGEN